MSWSLLEIIRNNPERLIDSVKKRNMDPSIVTEIVNADKEWRNKLNEINKLRHEHNTISSKIARAESKDKDELMRKAKEVLNILESKERELKDLEFKREQLLLTLPNLVSEISPVGDESASRTIKVVGKIKVYEGDKEAINLLKQLGGDYEITSWKAKGHAEMLENVLKYGNTLKAGEVTGSRFYYLFDDIVWLEFALLLYAMDQMTVKGYTLVIPPYMLKGEVIKSVIDLDTFKDAIYKVADEDLFLIATAEHPIAALHYNETIEAENLPEKFAGFSPAFRKEAGAANKDMKGIFRVHQFHKIEQFVFSLPETSEALHQELLSNAEEIFGGLGIPYRVIDIATGDLGACAYRKFDIEAWMPAQGRFREMISCSNCLDWQSYRMNIRFVDRKNNRKGYVHTLNSTAIASTRTITAILENYQTEDGVVEIPKVLRKYLELFTKAPKEFIYPRK
ncbi:serine--tRNA ligase [Sulfolobales archaeon HS-7]|nr:serine--tRNA ligase [Sulfolobales archaeon HS-7]